MEQVGQDLEIVGSPDGRRSRMLSAGRLAAQWVMYFSVSFALTAGALLLAHI